MVGIPASLYASQYTTLGTPCCTTVPHTTGYTAAPWLTCGLTHSWAQDGNMPWVEASFLVQNL